MSAGKSGLARCWQLYITGASLSSLPCSNYPCPAPPCPAPPCPALPCPALPCPALHPCFVPLVLDFPDICPVLFRPSHTLPCPTHATACFPALLPCMTACTASCAAGSWALSLHPIALLFALPVLISICSMPNRLCCKAMGRRSAAFRCLSSQGFKLL